jgi:succinate dehydrogenase/fumarate reductase flavoprotein subunit
VHGGNRLGGNSILDCVVFGRTAGRSAIEEVLVRKRKFVEL